MEPGSSPQVSGIAPAGTQPLPGVVLRAKVTTNADGEIVCSIEETNRIRRALGMRPLRPQILIRGDGMNENSVGQEQREKVKSLREKILDAKKKRQESEHVPSLGDGLVKNTSMSVLQR